MIPELYFDIKDPAKKDHYVDLCVITGDKPDTTCGTWNGSGSSWHVNIKIGEIKKMVSINKSIRNMCVSNSKK